MLLPATKLVKPLQATFTLLLSSDKGIESSMTDSRNTLTESPGISSLMTGLSKNVNVYWIGATSLAIWFLFVHSPPLLKARAFTQDAPFLWHLIGAYSVYLACIYNMLVTPSVNRPTHIWIGRAGMLLGVAGFVFGLYCSWWPCRDPLPDLGFSVGITIGGVMQMNLQVMGYRSIRRFQTIRHQLSSSAIDQEQLMAKKKAALATHIHVKISLFLVACGTPAALRIAPAVGINGTLVIIVVVYVLSLVAQLYANTFTARL